MAAIGLAACCVRLYLEHRTLPAVVYKTAQTSQIESEQTSTQKPDVSFESASEVTDPITPSESLSEMKTPEQIPIYLCGAVISPGVYFVEENSFLFELIDEAGGLAPDAASEHINMVMLLTDPISVYVPSAEELMPTAVSNKNVGQPGFIRSVSEDYVWGKSSSDKETGPINDEEDRKININTADEAELTKLSGIGEVTASAIVRYRTENGLFEKIEDIMKVPGIKQGRFDAIKDMIIV